MENYRALPVLRAEFVRAAGLLHGLGEEREYLGRPDFAAVDAKFMGVLIGFAERRKDLEGVGLV
jgi:hypothetical protein